MLSADQFLPGMESMREAKPHEQTESQFHSRPDVYTHGRYVSQASNEPMNRRVVFPGSWEGAPDGFHAGSTKAAHERLTNLEAPFHGHEARFYHGRVDPMHMQNTPEKGMWEDGKPDAKSMKYGLPTRRTDDPGREVDQIEEWRPKHHSSYYRNDYEDPGHTSVILPMEPVKYTVTDPQYGSVHHRTDFAPKNFQTWRGAVGTALGRGEHVPHHVRAAYEVSGGQAGHHGVLHEDFTPPYAPKTYGEKTVADRYEHKDQQIHHSLAPAAIKALGKQWN